MASARNSLTTSAVRTISATHARDSSSACSGWRADRTIGPWNSHRRT